MRKPKDLIIFSNGPGEVSTWVLPVVDTVRKRDAISNEYRVILIIHPCQFGSGTEHKVARSIEGIEWVIRPREYMKMLVTGLGMRKYSFGREGIIFSLGGDLIHPVLFRRRIGGKHALYAYTKNPGWERYYERIFVRNEFVKNKFLKRGVPESKVLVTGDLVYSSLKFLRERQDVREELGISENEKMVVFMPGSRDFEVRYMVPVFLKVIDEITDKLMSMKVFFLKSPYISYELIDSALAMGGRIREAQSISGRLESVTGSGFSVRFSEGKEVRVLEGGLEYWGKGIDFAVTLPGTSTIQLAYRGIPLLVVAPLNKPEVIPIEGVFGLLKWVPLIGKAVLRKSVLRYIKKFPYASLPNMYANEEIVPELFGKIKTASITERILNIVKEGELGTIKEKLSRFYFQENPVDTILKAIWEPFV